MLHIATMCRVELLTTLFMCLDQAYTRKTHNTNVWYLLLILLHLHVGKRAHAIYKNLYDFNIVITFRYPLEPRCKAKNRISGNPKNILKMWFGFITCSTPNCGNVHYRFFVSNPCLFNHTPYRCKSPFHCNYWMILTIYKVDTPLPTC